MTSSEKHTSPDPGDQHQSAGEKVSDREDSTSIREDGEVEESPTSARATNDDEVPSAATSGEPATTAPPLPSEPLPKDNKEDEDDGWDFHWHEVHQAYYFHNRFTGETTWENPRVPQASDATSAAPGKPANPPAPTPTPTIAPPPTNERLPAGGYNPAIHGDYDPDAWYAKNNNDPNNNTSENQDPDQTSSIDPATALAAIGTFNRFTGKWQGSELNPERHTDEAKSRRQMNAYFDVDAAANAHDGRSLKAERSGKKPSKNELKYFKEKRRARKEEKRRAWLRD
ncbi:hypothetical protein GGS20DRAFT_44341 [Poronia punctata]|nr:hypothetical protein GGS20DRAFT_44341 [Poronia punctata]